MRRIPLLQIKLFLIAFITIYLTHPEAHTNVGMHPILGGGTGGSGDIDEPHDTPASHYVTVALGA